MAGAGGGAAGGAAQTVIFDAATAVGGTGDRSLGKTSKPARSLGTKVAFAVAAAVVVGVVGTTAVVALGNDSPEDSATASRGRTATRRTPRPRRPPPWTPWSTRCPQDAGATAA